MLTQMAIVNTEEMRDRYGSFYEQAEKLRIDRQNVPFAVRALIPYAELWGIADDLSREQFVRTAPLRAIEDLCEAIAQFADELDDWLAGEQANSDNPTDEYVAFSAMIMAADFA